MRKRRWSLVKLAGRYADGLLLPILLSTTLPLVSCQSGGAPARPSANGKTTFSSPTPPTLTVTKTEYRHREQAQEKPSGTDSPPRAAPISLADCVRLALERQPRVNSQRNSLIAAEDAKRAIDALRVPIALVPELPVRRQQFGLGVLSAAAGLDQAERETVYAVTRTYYTVLYAREQQAVARGIVERLQATREAAQQALESGARDVTTADVNRTLVYQRLAQTQQTQAAQGVKRALAALREAVGLGPGVALEVPSIPLPEPDITPSLDAIIHATLSRRGELAQASLFVQIACLELEAQASHAHKRKMETFAPGTDIHSVQIPQWIHNSDYRPGAVPPEMPALLVGTQPERVKHAQSLQARAQTVLETTRNLIALEAEDAFLRWEEESRKASQAREATSAGDKLADDLRKDFTSGQKVRVEDVVTAQVMASQARSQYNEFLYRQILTLADLERITAGGFCAGLVALVERVQKNKEDGSGDRATQEAPQPRKSDKDNDDPDKSPE
jgi:outer membrane protein TolC